MLTANVNFYGTMRHLFKQNKITMELPTEFTLLELVKALTERYGTELWEEMISSAAPGYLQGHVQVFVDGLSSRGDLNERYGPFTGDQPQVDIYFVPNAEGGEE